MNSTVYSKPNFAPKIVPRIQFQSRNQYSHPQPIVFNNSQIGSPKHYKNPSNFQQTQFIQQNNQLNQPQNYQNQLQFNNNIAVKPNPSRNQLATNNVQQLSQDLKDLNRLKDQFKLLSQKGEQYNLSKQRSSETIQHQLKRDISADNIILRRYQPQPTLIKSPQSSLSNLKFQYPSINQQKRQSDIKIAPFINPNKKQQQKIVVNQYKITNQNINSEQNKSPYSYQSPLRNVKAQQQLKQKYQLQIIENKKKSQSFIAQVIKKYESQIFQNKKHHSSQIIQINNKHSFQLNQVKKSKQQVLKQYQQLKQTYSLLENQLKKQQNQKHVAYNQIKQLHQQIDMLNQQVDNVKNKLATYQMADAIIDVSAASKYQRQISQQQQRTSIIIKKLQDQLQSYKKRQNQLVSTPSFDIALKDQIQKNIDLKSKLFDLEQELMSFKQQYNEQRRKTQSLQRQLSIRQTKSIAELKAQTLKNQALRNDFQSQIIALKRTIQRLESQYKLSTKQIQQKDEFIMQYIAGRSDEKDKIQAVFQKFKASQQKRIQGNLIKQYEIKIAMLTQQLQNARVKLR